ncbi:RsfA family transcriptional regulator [Thermaerobacillus caldiproteolyticus]|uniref:Prespore-specific regulator n=1 Tax=Thermaerobacillus caldiproteolyticus TaxID=247480 RepID=A0A7W0BXI2_9BACL|nr:RsfA family transcriptional regulator [Anoxybacillus caldiproteolyticus]MBA2873610.1 prespore-specific regulator [Anoxybacillus caldiproteolyticus]
MKTRQDAWSHEEDLLLAETVLRYIREGRTQLAAFEEVGDQLNRTAAACGFRWNAEVRKQYVQAIELAKKQRKERKRALEQAKKLQKTGVMQAASLTGESLNSPRHATVSLLPAPNAITLEQCIAFLQTLQTSDYHAQALRTENEQLKKENAQFRQRNQELQKKLDRLHEQQTTIQEDYQALVKIMERARKLVLEEEHGSQPAQIFRMDKNGNLEQIAHH